MPGFRGAREIHYDPDHARTRAAAFAALPDYTPCARCHRVMWKWELEPPDKRGHRRSALHWDHNHMRNGYLGFSHAKCNRDEGAAEGGRRSTKTYGHTRRRRAKHPSTIQSAGTPGPGW